MTFTGMQLNKGLVIGLLNNKKKYKEKVYIFNFKTYFNRVYIATLLIGSTKRFYID